MNDLELKLKLLEEDFLVMPRKSDLDKINELRQELGLPVVDFKLKVEKTVKAIKVEQLDPKAVEIYDKYLDKLAFLKKHKDYALAVEKSTGNSSRTCVMPLATMGTKKDNKDAPLLCDVCLKPMILEGGAYHKKYADEAWAMNPDPRWQSFIKGGMVLDITLNGTLRVYHGYPYNPYDCCTVGKNKINNADEAFDNSEVRENCALMTKFVETKFSTLSSNEQRNLINDILNTVFGFDPGIGVNFKD